MPLHLQADCLTWASLLYWSSHRWEGSVCPQGRLRCFHSCEQRWANHGLPQQHKQEFAMEQHKESSTESSHPAACVLRACMRRILNTFNKKSLHKGMSWEDFQCLVGICGEFQEKKKKKDSGKILKKTVIPFFGAEGRSCCKLSISAAVPGPVQAAATATNATQRTGSHISSWSDLYRTNRSLGSASISLAEQNRQLLLLGTQPHRKRRPSHCELQQNASPHRRKGAWAAPQMLKDRAQPTASISFPRL